MSSPCRGPRLSLGAYVLGALDPAERAEVETHLAGCPACREELAALAGLPGLLAQLTVDDLHPENPENPAPPAADPAPEVLPRALNALATRRRSRRWRRAVMTVAAAAVIATGAGALGATVFGGTPEHTPPTGTALTATDPHTHVHATASLTARYWGTAIGLRLRGLPRGAHCRLVSVGRDGNTQIAGTWQATYPSTTALTLTGATSTPRPHLRALRVLTTTGTLLVTLPVPPP